MGEHGQALVEGDAPCDLCIGDVRATVDGVLTLSVPNAVHRGKCEQHRAAVEQALSEFASTAITIELVDDGGGGDGGGGRSEGDELPNPIGGWQ